MYFVWWLVIALVLGAIELLTVDFIFLMLFGGAILAAVASFFGAGLVVQMLVFGFTSVLLLAFVRPWARNYLQRTVPNRPMNAAGRIGAEVLVTEAVDHTQGLVNLQGEIWTARTRDPQILPVGSKATILAIDGATAVVAPVI